MTRNITIISLGLLILVTGGIFVARMFMSPGDQFAQCRATAIAGGPGTIGGPFTLVSETGETVTDETVLDQPALVYFGYTFCPDVCPVDTARNAEATSILEDRGVIVKPVFISVDPKRDTPEVMKEFTDYMHPRMLGLTGSAEQVKAASKAYMVYYKIHEPANDADDYYLVDHTTQTYLMLPGHGFVEFFRREDAAEQMADRVQCFVTAS